MRKINAGRNWLIHRVPAGHFGHAARLARPVQYLLLALLAGAAAVLELL
ncbi:hypothetical protein [Arthrobacter caoxuetaonis]|nr:hypothetical protein [Arthrobacter caoxuetaonis]MCC3282800.1 hypothetical protein [Arthrobacter caoxuetaonis]